MDCGKALQGNEPAAAEERERRRVAAGTGWGWRSQHSRPLSPMGLVQG